MTALLLHEMCVHFSFCDTFLNLILNFIDGIEKSESLEINVEVQVVYPALLAKFSIELKYTSYFPSTFSAKSLVGTHVGTQP